MQCRKGQGYEPRGAATSQAWLRKIASAPHLPILPTDVSSLQAVLMTDENPDLLLAELHAARSLALRPAVRDAAVITAADLWAELNRGPGAPVSLSVTRALRADTRIAVRYRRMLESLALAHAPVALAASDGAALRRIGAATLRLLPGAEGTPPLLVIENTAAGALELVGIDGSVLRLSLPPADEGTVILALGADFPDAAAALALVAATDTALYLLS